MSANGTTRTTIAAVAVIDAALARPAGTTLRELCEMLDCHPRTVRRHLAWMRRTLGVTVVASDWRGDKFIGYPGGQQPVFSAWVREAFR